MATVAIVFASAEPLAEFAVAGVELTERLVRQARAAGAARIYVMNGRRGYGSRAVNLDHAAMLGPRLHDGEAVLVLAGGLVADDRIISAVMAVASVEIDNAAPIVATWPLAAAERGVERIDAQTFAAGIAVYPAASVRQVAMNLGDWDLTSTLLRAGLSEATCVRLDLASALAAATTGRLRVPLACVAVTTSEAAAAATQAVLAATARPRSDAAGRYALAAVERAILNLLAPTPVSPRAVATVTGAAGVAAAIAFTAGRLGAGLALALLFGVLQHAGERLAEARAIRLRWQRWTMFAAAIGYSWWLALAVALTIDRGNGGPLAVAASLLLAQITAASETRPAIRLSGATVEPAGATDRLAALLAANRDSLALLLVPFAVAGQWYAGLTALAVYAVASFAVTHARFLARLPA